MKNKKKFIKTDFKDEYIGHYFSHILYTHKVHYIYI